MENENNMMEAQEAPQKKIFSTEFNYLVASLTTVYTYLTILFIG